MKWNEIEQSDRWKTLTPEQRRAARERYFDEFVAPQAPESFDPDDLRSRWMAYSDRDEAANAPGSVGPRSRGGERNPMTAKDALVSQAQNALGRGVPIAEVKSRIGELESFAKGDRPFDDMNARARSPRGGKPMGYVSSQREIDEATLPPEELMRRDQSKYEAETTFGDRLRNRVDQGFAQAETGFASLPMNAAVDRLRELDRTGDVVLSWRNDMPQYASDVFKGDAWEDFKRRTREEAQNATADFAASTAMRNRYTASLPQSPARQYAQKTGDWKGGFLADPLGYSADAAVPSAVAMAPALAVAGIARNPVAGAAAMGLTGFTNERAGSMVEYLADHGVNTASEDAIRKALSDPEMFAAADKYATTRASIIAPIDAVGAGLASRTIAPGVKGLLRREAVNTLVGQPVAQAAVGGAGEAAAGMATKGKVSGVDVFDDVLGEVAMSPVETAPYALDRVVNRNADTIGNMSNDALREAANNSAATRGERMAALMELAARGDTADVRPQTPSDKGAADAIKAVQDAQKSVSPNADVPLTVFPVDGVPNEDAELDALLTGLEPRNEDGADRNVGTGAVDRGNQPGQVGLPDAANRTVGRGGNADVVSARAVGADGLPKRIEELTASDFDAARRDLRRSEVADRAASGQPVEQAVPQQPQVSVTLEPDSLRSRRDAARARNDFDAYLSENGVDMAESDRRSADNGDRVPQPSGEPVMVGESRIAGQGIIATDRVTKPVTLFDLSADGPVRTDAGRYVNHSPQPNADVKIVQGRIVAVPNREIQPGQELTINYREIDPLREQLANPKFSQQPSSEGIEAEEVSQGDLPPEIQALMDRQREDESKRFVADALLEIGKNPALFRTPIYNGKTVSEVAKNAGVAYSGLSNEDGIRRHDLTVDQGEAGGNLKPAVVSIYEDRDNVWIDVLNLTSGGSAGDKIYGIAQSYARNANKNFAEDPAGLSDRALYRRPMQVMSGIMKSGSAETIKPGPFLSETRADGPRVRPVAAPASRNAERTLTEYALTNYANSALAVPEVENVGYDFDRNEFVWKSGPYAGAVVNDSDFDRLAADRRANPVGSAMVRNETGKADLSPAPVGGNTLKVAALIGALRDISTPAERSAVLGKLRAFVSGGARTLPSGLRGILASQPASVQASERVSSSVVGNQRESVRGDVRYVQPEGSRTVSVDEVRKPVRSVSGRDGLAAQTRPSGIPKDATSQKSLVTTKLGNRLRDFGINADFERVTLPDALASTLDALGRITGRNVVVFRVTEGKFNANGFVLPGDPNIYVNADSESPVLTVAAHEFLHQLRRDRPDLYGFISEEVQKRADMQAWREELDQRPLTRGKNRVNDDSLLEELVADGLGDSLSDPQFLASLAKRNPTKFRDFVMKALDYFSGLLRKIGRMKSLGSDQYLSDIQGLRDAYAQMLDDYDAGVMPDQSEGVIQFQSAGSTELAATGGDVQSIPDKGVMDRLQRDAQSLADLLKGQSFGTKAGGLGRIESAVVSKVFAVLQDPQILRAVVRTIPVDMMDLLARKKLAPEDALHDKAMLENMLSSNGPADVALPVNVSAAFVREVARAAAERAGLAGGSLEDGAAGSAGAGDSVLGAHEKNDPTKSAAFSSWFGDSKVVDADGKPLVVYHGTRHDFDSFRREGRRGQDRMHYFAADPGVASEYGGQIQYGSPNVMPVYLSLQNAYEFDADGAQWGSLPITLFPDEIRNLFDDRNVLRGREGSTPQIGFTDVNRAAQSAGYDGVIARNIIDGAGTYGDKTPTTVYVAFRPEQIKSVNNRGTFDPNDPRILFSQPKTPAQAAAENAQKRATVATATGAQQPVTFTYADRFEGPIRGRLNKLHEWAQDKMLSALFVQEDIEAARGAIADAVNVYRRENLMHGRTGDQLETLKRTHVDPLVKAIKAEGLDDAVVEDYLEAKFAPERNKIIAAKNPSMPDGGSGMTDAEAADFLAGRADGFRSGRKITPADIAKLQRIESKIKALRVETLDRLESSGLINAQAKAAMLAQAPNYVPLRGKDGAEITGGRGGAGKGIDVRGKPIKEALGRGAGNRAVNILAEMIADAERSIVQAEKNRVGKTLARLVLENPNPDLWEVEPVRTEQKLDSVGQVYQAVQSNAQDQDAIRIMHDGKPYFVRLSDPKLRDAMKNLGVDNSGAVIKFMGGINRYFSAVLTRYNPSFIAVNALRDLGFGMTGIAAEHGAKIAAKAAAKYPAAMRAMWRDNRGTLKNAAMDRYAREFSEAGGKTFFAKRDSVEEISSKVAAEFKSYGKLLRRGQVGLAWNKAVNNSALLKVVNDANDAVENAMRLSAYAALRESGKSVEQAAEYAKNITVNFNRKGQVATAANAVILFYNAATQGAHRSIKLLRNPKVMAAMGGLAGLQALLAAYAMGSDDEDDDGLTAWEKIPAYEKERNLIIPIVGVDAKGNRRIRMVKWPMPYGFNVFSYAGGRMAELAMTKEPKPAKFANDMGNAVVNAFSPVKFIDGMDGIKPHFMKIFDALGKNEDDLGMPIRVSDDFDKFDKPRAYSGKADTPEAYKAIAKGLNAMGGGDEVTPPKMFAGMLDWAPEDLEYLTEQLTGGLGRFASDSYGVGEKLFAGIDTKPTDYPVLRSLVGEVDQNRATQGTYREREDEIEREVERVRRTIYAGREKVGEGRYTLDVEAKKKADELMRNTPELDGYQIRRLKNGSIFDKSGAVEFEAKRGLAKSYKDAKKEVDRIKAEIRAAQAQAFPSLKAKSDRIKELQAQREKAQREFNEAFAKRER